MGVLIFRSEESLGVGFILVEQAFLFGRADGSNIFEDADGVHWVMTFFDGIWFRLVVFFESIHVVDGRLPKK